MMGIERNGLSGLALRTVVITMAALMFGCAPNAPSASNAVSAVVVAER